MFNGNNGRGYRPKISIITATYNSAATVVDTLRSVLNQDYDNVEHLIIDGLSSDATLSIVDQFKPLYKEAGKELICISESDDGLYDAMNKGIRLASGDIVGILNSDDFYTSEDILSTIASSMEEVDAVYGDIHYVSPDNTSKCVRYYSSKGFSRRRMLMGYMPAHPSFYCKRRVYQTFGTFDTSFKVGADFEQLFRLIYINRIVTRYISRDFVTMRTGGASTSGLRSHIRILKDHFRAYRKNGVRWAVLTDCLRYPGKIISILENKLKT